MIYFQPFINKRETTWYSEHYFLHFDCLYFYRLVLLKCSLAHFNTRLPLYKIVTLDPIQLRLAKLVSDFVLKRLPLQKGQYQSPIYMNTKTDIIFVRPRPKTRLIRFCKIKTFFLQYQNSSFKTNRPRPR